MGNFSFTDWMMSCSTLWSVCVTRSTEELFVITFLSSCRACCTTWSIQSSIHLINSHQYTWLIQSLSLTHTQTQYVTCPALRAAATAWSMEFCQRSVMLEEQLLIRRSDRRSQTDPWSVGQGQLTDWMDSLMDWLGFLAYLSIYLSK